RASRNNSHSSCKVKELLGIHGQSCHPGITPRFSAQKNKQRSSVTYSLTGRRGLLTQRRSLLQTSLACEGSVRAFAWRVMFPPPIRCGLAQQHPVDLSAVA